MEKDERLLDIYLKIHHKKPLTMDDLRYLAEYDPECFLITCKNIVHNVPEAKTILEPLVPPAPEQDREPELTERQNIEKILENLKRLEMHDFSAADIDTDRVKSLLGNLYMELLLSHKEEDMPGAKSENSSLFDKRA